MKNFSTDQPCVACGKWTENGNTLHHVRTRKAYPELTHAHFNLMPLDAACHRLIHQKGTRWMADEFPGVERWLIANGWERVRQADDRPKWMAPNEI